MAVSVGLLPILQLILTGTPITSNISIFRYETCKDRHWPDAAVGCVQVIMGKSHSVDATLATEVGMLILGFWADLLAATVR
jgi:hypothetical protein